MHLTCSLSLLIVAVPQAPRPLPERAFHLAITRRCWRGLPASPCSEGSRFGITACPGRASPKKEACSREKVEGRPQGHEKIRWAVGRPWGLERRSSLGGWAVRGRGQEGWGDGSLRNKEVGCLSHVSCSFPWCLLSSERSLNEPFTARLETPLFRECACIHIHKCLPDSTSC